MSDANGQIFFVFPWQVEQLTEEEIAGKLYVDMYSTPTRYKSTECVLVNV